MKKKAHRPTSNGGLARAELSNRLGRWWLVAAVLMLFACEKGERSERSQQLPRNSAPKAGAPWPGPAAPHAQSVTGDADVLPPVDTTRRRELLTILQKPPIPSGDIVITGASELERSAPHDAATVAALTDIYREVSNPTVRAGIRQVMSAEEPRLQTTYWILLLEGPNPPPASELTSDLVPHLDKLSPRVQEAAVNALGTGRLVDEDAVWKMSQLHLPGLEPRLRAILLRSAERAPSWRLVDTYKTDFGLDAEVALALADSEDVATVLAGLRHLTERADLRGARAVVAATRHSDLAVQAAAQSALISLLALEGSDETVKSALGDMPVPPLVALALGQQAFRSGDWDRAETLWKSCTHPGCAAQLVLMRAVSTAQIQPQRVAEALRKLKVPPGTMLWSWPGAPRGESLEGLADEQQRFAGSVLRIAISVEATPGNDSPKLDLELTNTGTTKLHVEHLRLNAFKVGARPTIGPLPGFHAEGFDLGPKKTRFITLYLAQFRSGILAGRVSAEIWASYSLDGRDHHAEARATTLVATKPAP